MVQGGAEEGITLDRPYDYATARLRRGRDECCDTHTRIDGVKKVRAIAIEAIRHNVLVQQETRALWHATH